MADERQPYIPTHPEEMSTDFDLHVGKHITLQGRARITPAGVISAGVAAAAIIVAVGYLVGVTRRTRR